jgi:hypothetical protein
MARPDQVQQTLGTFPLPIYIQYSVDFGAKVVRPKGFPQQLNLPTLGCGAIDCLGISCH